MQPHRLAEPMPATSATVRLKRVATVAMADGVGIMLLAGLGLVLGITSGWWGDTGFCLAGCVMGAAEYTTGRKLRREHPTRRHFLKLAASQGFLIVLVTSYALWRLSTMDPAVVLEAVNSSPLAQHLLLMAGDPLLVESVVTLSIRLTYVLLIPLTVLFQGGIALYYLRSGRSIQREFAPPPLPSIAP